MDNENFCDSADCDGQDICRALCDTREATCARFDVEPRFTAFHCEYVEVLDLVATPSIDWFLKQQCTGSEDCPAPKHLLGCFASMPADMVTMTLDEFETKYLS